MKKIDEYDNNLFEFLNMSLISFIKKKIVHLKFSHLSISSEKDFIFILFEQYFLTIFETAHMTSYNN